MGEELKITVIATGFTSRDARRIERVEATRMRGPTQGSLAMPQAQTEPNGAASCRAGGADAGDSQGRHAGASSCRGAAGDAGSAAGEAGPALSWDELRQLTGASEDELDIPTFLRNGE